LLRGLVLLKQLALMIPPLRALHEERNRYAQSLDCAYDEIQTLKGKIAALELKEARLVSLATTLRDVENANFPVYINDGYPAFAGHKVEDLSPLVVVTIPKSGTYLIGAYLKEIGLVDSGVHMDEIGFSDYRNRTISEMVSNYRDFRKIYPLGKSIKLLREGQFAVGHIGFNEQAVSDLAKTNIIFAVREIRTVMISMMRWLSRPGRGEASHWKSIEDNQQKTLAFLHENGSGLIGWFDAIAGWINCPDVLTVKFEELTADGVTAADLAFRVAKKAGVTLPIQQAGEMLNKVIMTPTKTWSGKHSELNEFWSDEAEALFRAIGGVGLNQRLGYFE
jgi:hypothetical protein